MIVKLPENLTKPDAVYYTQMGANKVYRYGELLVCQNSSGCIIVIDTEDSSVLTFDDCGDFGEWLGDTKRDTKGEVTNLQMTITVS